MWRSQWKEGNRLPNVAPATLIRAKEGGAWGMKLRRWLVQGLGLACLVLGGILLSGGVVSLTARSAYAQAPTVSSIVVQGNQRVEADTIRSYFRPGPTGHLDAFQIDEGVKALISTGLFQEVRPTIQGGRLTITVIENPVINRIVFEIAEGVKTGVKAIDFVGNRAYSSYRLKEVIKTSETGLLLAFLQTGDIYDPDRIEADRELLRRFYLKHGYIDVRIVSAVGEYDPVRRGFVVTFTIEEGEQYRIGVVDVVSNSRDIDPALLRVRLRVFGGDIYNAEAIEKSVED